MRGLWLDRFLFPRRIAGCLSLISSHIVHHRNCQHGQWQDVYKLLNQGSQPIMLKIPPWTADTCKHLSILLLVDVASTIGLVAGTTTTNFVCAGFILRLNHAVQIPNAKTRKLILLKGWKQNSTTQGFLYRFWAFLQPDYERESHGLSHPCIQIKEKQILRTARGTSFPTTATKHFSTQLRFESLERGHYKLIPKYVCLSENMTVWYWFECGVFTTR